MKYRKKPIVIDATQWFKNGDHPLDHSEGDIVRYFRRPDVPDGSACRSSIPCGHTMREHGWIDTPEGGHTVCPGDWIITGVEGKMYPCKPDVFAATYEPA